jgi:ribose transport system substrate-binding protein
VVSALLLAVGTAACGEDEAESGGGGGGGAAADTPAQQQTTAEATGNVPADPDAAEFEKAEPGSGEGLKIGYISLGEAVPFVKLVSDSIREQAKAAGAQLVFCDSQLDGAKALDCARNFKTQAVDAIINFQVDEKSAPRICAAGPDVPVIAVDINQKPCQVSFMGANNERAGTIAGDGMGQYFKANENCEYDAVVTMESPAAGIVNDQRIGGALKGFEAVCGPVKNRRKVDGKGTIEGGQEKFRDVLTALPGAKKIIVMSLNDDMALGALAAAKSQGRAEDLFLSGQGADPTSHCEIKDNPQWIGDTAYFPERYGEILVPNAIRAAKGEKVEPQLFVPHTFVNKDNLSEFYEPASC